MITGKASRSKSQVGREKQIYVISAKGRKAFEHWLGVAPREQPPRSELLLKVFCAAEVPVEVTLAHVSALRERQLKMLVVYGGVEKQLERVHRDNPKLPFWLMTLSFGRHRSQAMIDWCDETL